MATAPEKDVDVLLRTDQKLLPGNEGPEKNLLGWGAGSRSPHLPEGDETCKGLPPLQRAAPGKQSRERCSSPQGCQTIKCWQITLVKALSGCLHHIHSCEINWDISFSKKKDPAWLVLDSLDQGREVVVVMKIITTEEASLTQYGLCSHTCLFVEALFENPGRWFRLDLTKFWLLKVVFSWAAGLIHCWRNEKQEMKRGHKLVITSNYRK